jgi:hypothetical protein
VDVDLRVRSGQSSLEARVDETELSPVGVDGTDVLNVELGIAVGSLQRSKDGSNGRLGGHTGQRVGSGVNGISTSVGTSSHGSNSSTGGVVSVNVDGEVGVLGADSANEYSSGLGAEDTSHVLDSENVSSHLNDLVGKVEVVLEVVLLLGVQHVTRVTDGSLNNSSSLLDGADTDSKLLNIVKSVEDTENINSVLLGLLDEVVDGVVGKGGVSNSVGSTQQHLEGNVGHKLTELAKTVPGVLVQETVGNIEGSSSPALKSVGVGVSVGSVLSDGNQVSGTDTSGQERLVGVTPGGVHEKSSLVLADSLGESLRSLLDQDVSPSSLARNGDIDLLSGGIVESGEDDVTLELGLSDLSLDGRSVDSNVSEISKKLLSTVLGLHQREERRSVIDESGPAVSGDESLMGKERSQERDVGLDSTDSELNKSTENLSAGDLVGGSVASALDQHRVVVRGDDSTGETVSSIKTDSVTTSGTVDLDLSGIGTEVLGGVLSGDTALNGVTTGRDTVLGQSKLLKTSSGSNLDLGGNNINSGNLLGDSVLDLDTGVDLDEVVTVLLVNQELSSTSVTVANGLGQTDGIVKNSLADVLGKVLSGGNLDDLLVTTLNGTVTLVQVDDVSVVISEKLDLNVLGFVEEALDEDGSVAESRKSPMHGAC